jgi:hypothetical protein
LSGGVDYQGVGFYSKFVVCMILLVGAEKLYVEGELFTLIGF